jgi:hypothetical protein
MNRLVRGSILVAVAGGLWACGVNPFDENLDTIASIQATPQVVFVSNADSQAVVVEAVNDLGQQNAAEFTISNIVGNFTVNPDTTFGLVIEGENLKTRARFFVKPNTTTTFETGSFDVSAGGKTTTVKVSVTPSTVPGTLPIAFSNNNPALGDTITLTLPANVRITDTSSITVSGSLAGAIVGASADSNTIQVLAAPGLSGASVQVNNVAISYLPGQSFNLQTSAPLTTSNITTITPTFSSNTPAGGAQVTMTASGAAGAYVWPDEAAIVITYPTGGDAWIDSVSADGSTVYFVPQPGASGTPLISGAALNFLPDAILEFLTSTVSMTVGPSAFPGTDDETTAPALPIPAPGTSITFYDGGTFGASAQSSGADQVYSMNFAASTTLTFHVDWNNDADVDILFLDDPVTAYQCSFGGASSNHPEQVTCTFAPGAYLLTLNLYAGAPPPVMQIMVSQP